MSYYFHPGAEAEHFETIAFFESRQLGLGAAYLSELEALMVNVVYAPHRCGIERKPNIRCASLKRFPSKLFFVMLRELFKFSLFRINGVDQITGWIACYYRGVNEFPNLSLGTSETLLAEMVLRESIASH